MYFSEHVIILCRNGQVTGVHSLSGPDDNQSARLLYDGRNGGLLVVH
jgi:hypothetical protein